MKLQKSIACLKSFQQLIRLPLPFANGGFTLIEILVVVLIIGILGAIMLPQYQRAVLKSRYSGMMPIAKALAEANEVFYLEHGEYSENPADLLVAGRNTAQDGAYPDGTRVLMYDEDGLSYVRVMNDNVPNARYIVYQKHSENFADTTQCEAADDRANELCVALGGQIIEEGNSSGESEWTAYLLSGRYGSTDSFADAGSGGENPGTNTNPQTPSTCGGVEQPADIEPTETNPATGTATCVNGQWKYQWSGGNVYDTDYDSSTIVCTGDSAYKCAGSEFKGMRNRCAATQENGCADSTFSGEQSYCASNKANGCAGSTFSGKWSTCQGVDFHGCAGTIIQAGGICNPAVPYGCDGAKYGTNPDHTGAGANMLGSCWNYNGYCPDGVPVHASGSWNSTTQAYDYTWKGGYCDPNAMVSGKCPAGTHSADANGTLDGKCWDGNGNRIACE